MSGARSAAADGICFIDETKAEAAPRRALLVGNLGRQCPGGKGAFALQPLRGALPAAEVPARVLDEARVPDRAEEQVADDAADEADRAAELEEEDHPGLSRVVPHLVVEGVVEH